MKPRIRVIDIPTTATAEEAERLLNGPCADGYYSDKILTTGLPDSVWARAIFKLRANPEKFVELVARHHAQQPVVASINSAGGVVHGSG
jgi:hypothetical protein